MSPAASASHLGLRPRAVSATSLDDELGLDHFEGRGWRGFHHHGALCIAAYAFLAAERPPNDPFLLGDVEEACLANRRNRGRGGVRLGNRGTEIVALDLVSSTYFTTTPFQIVFAKPGTPASASVAGYLVRRAPSATGST